MKFLTSLLAKPKSRGGGDGRCRQLRQPGIASLFHLRADSVSPSKCISITYVLPSTFRLCSRGGGGMTDLVFYYISTSPEKVLKKAPP